MPSIVDQLVVELKLDPTQFSAGLKATLAQMAQAKATAQTQGKALEESGLKIGEAFNTVSRRALGLFAILSGGHSLETFARQIISNDAAIGRFSRTIGVSIPTVARWQNAARLVGGEAAGMAQSFQSLQDALAGLKVGIPTDALAVINAITVSARTASIDLSEGPEKVLLRLSDALKKLHDENPDVAGVLARRLPFYDPGLFELLIRGSATVKQITGDMEKLGGATDRSSAAFQKFGENSAKVLTGLESLGRSVLTPLVEIFNSLFSVAEKPQDIEGKQALTDFGRSIFNFGRRATGLTSPEHERASAYASGIAALKAKMLGSSTPGIDQFAAAIGQIESSGRYNEVGPQTRTGDRAYGKYQVMGSNIGQWTKEALGRSMTTDEFLASPSAQDAVFRKKFGDYVNKYGNKDDAASAWLTGRPLSQGGNSKDVLGTSGYEYVRRFNSALGSQGGSSEINVNGPITINTQARDAKGIATDLKSALEQRAARMRMATQANSN
jgi:hypothetical protein